MVQESLCSNAIHYKIHKFVDLHFLYTILNKKMANMN